MKFLENDIKFKEIPILNGKNLYIKIDTNEFSNYQYIYILYVYIYI